MRPKTIFHPEALADWRANDEKPITFSGETNNAPHNNTLPKKQKLDGILALRLKEAIERENRRCREARKKGKLKGAEVYTLTLTERETCPTSCHHWNDCYGNNMPFAHRIEHGEKLEARLIKEVKEICTKAKNKGRLVLVRLHVLGISIARGMCDSGVDFWYYTRISMCGGIRTYRKDRYTTS